LLLVNDKGLKTTKNNQQPTNNQEQNPYTVKLSGNSQFFFKKHLTTKWLYS